MGFDGTSKAIATEAWSELVHSVLSWTPPSDMSMEYYYTLPEDNSNRLEIYKYKLGTENIEARFKSGTRSQVVPSEELKYHHGIEYVQDCIRSTDGYYSANANKCDDQQGIENIRDPMRSIKVVEVDEGEKLQGLEDIQACMRSTHRYDVVQVYEQQNQQLIEPARHSCSIGSTGSFEHKQARNENHQSISSIREPVRSKGLAKGMPEPETWSQQRISYEQVMEMSTLFDDLLIFIENYNLHGSVEKPTLRFQVLQLIKLLYHYGIDTIGSGVEEELEYMNQRNDAVENYPVRNYQKSLEVMLRICESGTCQSTIYEIICEAENYPLMNPQNHSTDGKDGHSHPTLSTNISSLASGADRFESGSNAKREPPGPEGLADAQSVAQQFTFRELAAATNDFSPESYIGEGGFGRVYKGRLQTTGQVVAVKKLDISGLQGNRQFLVEVLMLSILHHPNLVNLIGYCADRDQRLLVYKFMPLGSLYGHLHDLPPEREPLDWNTRMKIAAGAAKGLEFLHDKASPSVICRDFKSSNILLDEGFHPRISDLGLAKLGPVGEKSHVSTMVMGTYGYLASEYVKSGKLTVKCDVFSFGVVLLELITGRKAFDSTRPQGQHELVTLSRPLFVDQKKFTTFADPRLQGQYPMRGLCQALAG